MQRVAVEHDGIATFHSHAKQRSPRITTMDTTITISITIVIIIASTSTTTFIIKITINVVFMNNRGIIIVSAILYVLLLLLALNDKLSTSEVTAAWVAEHDDDREDGLSIPVQHKISPGIVDEALSAADAEVVHVRIPLGIRSGIGHTPQHICEKVGHEGLYKST